MIPPCHSALRATGFLLAWSGMLLASSLQAQVLPLGPSSEGDEEEDEGLPALQMLTEGSELRKVIIPRYDESLRLSSVLRADMLRLVDRKTIEAEVARIEFFKADQTLRGTIDLKTATLTDQRFLRSSVPVQVVSEDLNAKGTALVYDLKLSKGFVHGPSQTDIFLENETAMNTPITPAFGLVGATMLAASALHAAEIKAFTPQQLEGLNRLADSRTERFLITNAATEKELAAVAAEDAKANKTLETFLKEAAIDLPKGEAVDLTSEVPAPSDEPKFKKPASIRSKEGFYFDSEAGIIVFLKDVSVDHPEFELTGADEIKVFMDKEDPKDEGKKPDEKPAPKQDDDMFGSADFGDPARIVATGAVVVNRKVLKPGDKKAKASGRQMVMDLKTDDLIIRGGNPWIISDTANGRVVDPNGYIRINLKSGDASFVGDSRGFVETDKPKP